MPIGPVTPGNYTNVTHDTTGVLVPGFDDPLLALYPQLQAPSPTMPVVADDIAQLTLALLNVQEALYERLPRYYTNYHLESATDPTTWTSWSNNIGPGAWASFMTGLWDDNPFTHDNKVLVRLICIAKTTGGEGLIRLAAGVSGGTIYELPNTGVAPGLSGVARARVTTTLGLCVVESEFEPSADNQYAIQIHAWSNGGSNTVQAYGPARLQVFRNFRPTF